VAKSELYGNPLIPIVLVAGILSGSLWRGTPPADTGKPGDSSSNGDKSDGAQPDKEHVPVTVGCGGTQP